MPLLEPDGSLDLPGARVRSVGVSGQVDAVPLEGLGAGVRGDVRDLDEQLSAYAVPDDGAGRLAGALARQDLRPVLAVPLDDLVAMPGFASARALAEGPSVELAVEAPDEDEGQVVLEVDATGVVSWHTAVPPDAGAVGAIGAGDRAGLEQVFQIPVRQVDVPGGPALEGADRALVGIGVRKLLQVFRYPIQRAAGAAGRQLVSAWESRYRKYGVRMVDGPDRGGGGSGGAGFELTADQLEAMRGKPALVLVHGTFTTGSATFPGLLRDTQFMAEMRHRYDDRILIFDYPSIHVEPAANARWLLEQFPPGFDLVLDVVAHSRGGLVSRALTAAGTADAVGRPVPRLRTTIHVASPNAGTALADPARWGKLLDTMTNLAMLVPDDLMSVPLTAVIEVVKQIGTGVLSGLDGLAAMIPGSPALARLAPASPSAAGASYAIASNFEPVSAPLPWRALDVLVDPFFGEANDLVVPTQGVSRAAGLTVKDVQVLPQTPAISHLTYFHDQAVRQRIAEWLPRAGPDWPPVHDESRTE
jgi:hypothetical protein